MVFISVVAVATATATAVFLFVTSVLTSLAITAHDSLCNIDVSCKITLCYDI